MKPGFLALDCTGETFCCGLEVEGRFFTEVVGLNPRRALREMPHHIQHLLQNAGLSYRDIGGIGVTQGPGSFTGVRLGVTLAKTIAFAADCGLLPVDTLKLLSKQQESAFRHSPGTIAVALDARKKELYCFLSGDDQSQLLSPSDFQKRLGKCSDLRCLVGPGFKAYPELIPDDFQGPVEGEREHSAPDTALLCQLTREAAHDSALVPYGKVEPVYLRRADVQVSGGAKG